MSSKSVIAVVVFLSSQVFAGDLAVKKYSDVKVFLHELERAHPGVVQDMIVGPSDSGEMIEGVKIGHGAIHNLVVGAHHGNEYGSTEVAMAFATSLANNPIADQTVYIIPVLNVSGYNAKQREEKDATGHYRDPNRDYPGPCGTEGPHHLKSTNSLAKFIDHENIISSATLHTFYPAVVYPWGMSTYDLSTPYDDTFKTMVNNATEMSHYTVGNSTDVIYPADGAYEDYAFWKSGVWSILFELGHSHNPTQAEVDEMVRVNIPGLRKMLEQAPREKAVNHDFTGRCETRRLARFDRHDE
jgi:carboxypeptidase T